jgi:hypothetical protein
LGLPDGRRGVGERLRSLGRILAPATIRKTEQRRLLTLPSRRDTCLSPLRVAGQEDRPWRTTGCWEPKRCRRGVRERWTPFFARPDKVTFPGWEAPHPEQEHGWKATSVWGPVQGQGSNPVRHDTCSLPGTGFASTAS